MPRKSQDRNPSPGQGFLLIPGESIVHPAPISGAIRKQIRADNLKQKRPALAALALRLAHDIDNQADPSKALPLLKALADVLTAAAAIDPANPAGTPPPNLIDELERARRDREG